MDDRSAKLALLALVSGALAALGLLLAAWLPPFADCRADYRMPREVYASLACQVYAAITLFSLLLCAVAVVMAVVVAVRFYLMRD